MIEHNVALELLRLSMLVYNYGEKFTLNEDETIEIFISDLNDNISISNENILLDISKNCPSGKVCKFVSDEKTDTQGCIVIDDKNICIVFRGSSSIKDWLVNLQFRKHHLKDDIWIHKGFYKAIMSVYRTLADKVKEQIILFPNHNIYITGHSLAGALSSLFGYLLSDEIENNITIVAFASPRVGNKGWYKSFMKKKNLKEYRINNNRDIVTALPYINYYHVGESIRLFKKKYYLSNVDKNSIFKYWRFTDHLCSSYYKNLNIITW